MVSYKLTVNVEHSKYESVTFELKKVADSQLSFDNSSGAEEPVVKPFKGIQNELFKSLQPFYSDGLQKLEFLVDEENKKKKPVVLASWDETTSKSDSKLHKAIKDAIIKIKSGEVKKVKKAKQAAAPALLQPKRKKEKVVVEEKPEMEIDEEEDDEDDDHLPLEADNDEGDGGEAATIQDRKGAIKKVKGKKGAAAAVAPTRVVKTVKPTKKNSKNKVTKVAAATIAKPRKQQKAPKVAAPGRNTARNARASINPGAYNTTIGDANNGVTPGVPVDAMTAGAANGGAVAPPAVVQ